MAGMLEFNEDAARRVEAAYTTPDIVAQRASVLSMLALEPGEHVLDMGVGPGFLAAEMAAEVGAAGRVCGIDVSDTMLAIAAARVVPVRTLRRSSSPGVAQRRSRTTTGRSTSSSPRRCWSTSPTYRVRWQRSTGS